MQPACQHRRHSVASRSFSNGGGELGVPRRASLHRVDVSRGEARFVAPRIRGFSCEARFARIVGLAAHAFCLIAAATGRPYDPRMSTLTLRINGKSLSADVDPNTPLLWVLRDSLGLVGTKFGCGMALCGACTVLADGEPVRACSVPVSGVAGKNITTIEGLAKSETQLHPLQEAWIEHDVPQCGYCQAGQLMSASALLAKNPQPSDADIDAAMAGNLCRCGTYQRIRAAIHTAADKIAKRKA
jgi:isoquinoline 1-oxidoreductase subunit alpha